MHYINLTHYDPGSNRERSVSLEHQRRRIGDRDPICGHPNCLERDPFAMSGTAPDLLCYEHRAIEAGRDWVESHHVAGKANDVDTTARVPGNDHRVLSDLQQDWPSGTLRNPEMSPLIRAAAAIRGWLDVLWVVLTRAIGWIPSLLENLDSILTDEHGSGWWVVLGLKGPE